MNISTMKSLVFTLLLIATRAFGADGIVQTLNGTTVAGGTVKTTQTNVLQMNWDSVIRAGDLGSPNAGGYIRWSGTNVNTQIYSGDNSDLLFTSDGNKYYFTGGVPMVGNGSGLTNIPYAGVKGQLWVINVDGSIQNVNASDQTVLIYPSGKFVIGSGGDGNFAYDPSLGNFSLGGASWDAQFSVDSIAGISGLGSGITALNASQLTSGTVPDDAFPDPLPAVSGENLTAINASVINSGTVSTARLPNGTLIQTNFISGFVYSNSFGVPLQISANARITTAAVNGDAALDLRISGAVTNSFSAVTTVAVTLAMSYTNVLSGFIPVNATYTFTNTSTGAGNASSVSGGQLYHYP